MSVARFYSSLYYLAASLSVQCIDPSRWNTNKTSFLIPLFLSYTMQLSYFMSEKIVLSNMRRNALLSDMLVIGECVGGRDGMYGHDSCVFLKLDVLRKRELRSWI